MRRISYSSIRRFENCMASYLYYLLVPRIDFSIQRDVSLFGRKFHEWAEVNFKPNSFDAIMDESGVDEKEMQDLAMLVRSREYFSLPAVNEMEISHDIEPIATIWGFPDRISIDFEKRILIIPDYKTQFEPDPASDIRQLQLYGYIIYNNELVRKKIAGILCELYPESRDVIYDILDSLKPENIKLILDYVKSDYVYSFQFDEQKMKRFERYLFGVLRRISDLENEFNKHKNMRKITHSDGNCAFCSMAGMCLPYQIIINSYYDTEFEKEITTGWSAISNMESSDGVLVSATGSWDAGTPIRIIQESFCSENGIELEAMLNGEIRMNTMGLIAEFQDRQRVAKINELRLTALKRTLLSRMDEGDSTVSKYFRKQKNTVVSYPTSDVLKHVLPRIVKGALKDVRFKDMIDFNAVENNLLVLMEKMLNSGIKKSNVPEQYHDDMDKFKVVSYTNPYLRSVK